MGVATLGSPLYCIAAHGEKGLPLFPVGVAAPGGRSESFPPLDCLETEDRPPLEFEDGMLEGKLIEVVGMVGVPAPAETAC